ncbi:TonB-dependent receptor plug domain-containing protein [Povalibacter sp.]|uniref:TonB-dependent receptor plug domain-containing protein n=1 Tax=Povalibacter sp. TaxID=1962978 RepID=UPI002F3F15C0
MRSTQLKLKRGNAALVVEAVRTRLRSERSGAVRDGSTIPLLGLMTLVLTQSATAQTVEAASADAADAAPVAEVIVTGSRIATADGYSAPTPVSVLGAEMLQSFGSPNVADAVNTLPALSGSVSPATSVTTASTGNSNINALNLRALGENRTLVLVDGQRSVASSLSGLVDVNLIPQDLISRVEVVTGGASAVYGSDALGGVVNFILDKDFTGFKSTAQYGATTHGDGANWMTGLTYGTPFADGRGHFIFSASVRDQDVIAINRRDWNLKGIQFMNNPSYTSTNGQPQRLLLDQVSVSTGISGGIITNTPLRGTAFGAGGTPYQFQFGDLVSDPDMRGGDWESTQIRGTRAGASLSGGSRTTSGFMRASWDLTDNVNVFFQAARARDENHNYAFSLEDTGSISLSVENAFLPDSIRQQMLDANVSTFRLGTMHPDLDIAVPTNDRTITRFVVGASGSFGDSWEWDAYYQRGVSDLHAMTKGIWVNSYLALAYDSVVDPSSGNIVCRSTLTNPSNGCVPYNPMGTGVNSQAAVDYVEGNGEKMWRYQQLTQDVVAVALNGKPFSTWAGDVGIATGAEWRKEWIGNGRNDAISNRWGWWVGGYPSTQGSYEVSEAYLEAIVPLARNLPALQALDLSGAIRVTDYSTSGSVETWKVGLNWTPIDDIRFRTTLSHDIRAPNLEELFSRGSGGAPAVTNPWLGDSTEYITSPRLGNSNLTPEQADGFGVGFVLTPTFMPGLALAIDYWSVEIEDAIGLPTTQDIIDNCYQGLTAFCSAVQFTPGTQNLFIVDRTPFNYTLQVARGVDYEASYQFSADALHASLPGSVMIRALATNYKRNATTTEGIVDDTAGQNTSFGPPDWKWSASIGYSLDSFNASLMARGVSSGVYDNDWIECTSGCPASTTKYVTVSENDIESVVFFDASASYKFFAGDVQVEGFLNVRNITDKDPPVVAANPGGFNYTIAPANARLYDVLGRTFTVGFRMNW